MPAESTTPITGTYGQAIATATGRNLAEITNWSASFEAAVRKYQSNLTNGFPRRPAGGKDMTGEFTYLLDTASGKRRRFDEGDQFTVQLAVDAALAHSIIVPVTIIGVDANDDIDGDGLVGGRVRFGANGAWTLTGALAINEDITSST